MSIPLYSMLLYLHPDHIQQNHNTVLQYVAITQFSYTRKKVTIHAAFRA